MSLLEDVFLQDEAGEAQELERVIEGDEFEERVRSDSDDNSEREDEAEEDKRRVDPSSTKTRRVTKNSRFTLNPARLIGPRGIQVIPEHFKDFKFKGKGHEKEDLDLVLKKLEHWAYRLYPKFKFEDCLKKIEILGKKRPVMVHLHKIRTDQYISEETVVQRDSSNDEDEKEPEDEFDKLLKQQIEIARSTPAPGSVRKNMESAVKENRPPTTPIATSSPTINSELRERMLKNRKLAEERRLARIQSANNNMANKNDQIVINTNGNGITDEINTNINKKNIRSNVIDSSDDEVTPINTSVTVDIHKNISNNEHNDSKSNEDSNNILRMDTDSDTDVQIDNINTFSLPNNELNENQKSNVNGDDGNVITNNDKINDTMQARDTVLDDSKSVSVLLNEVNDLNEGNINVNNDITNIDNSKEDEGSLDKDNIESISKEIPTNLESAQRENVNEIMDVDFGEEF